MTQVKKGQFIILDPKSVDMSGLQGQPKKDDKDKPSSPSELETPPTDVEKPEFDMPADDESLPKAMPVDMPKAHFQEDPKDPFGDMPMTEQFKFQPKKKKHKVKIRRIK